MSNWNFEDKALVQSITIAKYMSHWTFLGKNAGTCSRSSTMQFCGNCD